MILPIITAVTREVFVQTPRGQIEAALALVPPMEVVRTTVLPFVCRLHQRGDARIGRALGETIALLIILRGTQKVSAGTLFDGGYTFASKIAATASEFNDQYKPARTSLPVWCCYHFDVRGELAGARAVAGRGAR